MAALGIRPAANPEGSSESDTGPVLLLAVGTVAGVVGLALIVRRERRKRELPAGWTGLS